MKTHCFLRLLLSQKFVSLYIASLLFATSMLSLSATAVEGVISSDVTWSKSDSPYTVSGNIGVSKDAKLIIEPGVEIEFLGDFEILVNGAIDARGTAEEQITFSGREGITMLLFQRANLSISHLAHIVFSNAQWAVSVGKGDDGDGNNSGNLEIDHLTLSNCGVLTGGSESGASVTIKDSSFTNSTVKGSYPRSETIFIENSTFKKSTIFSDSYNKGIYLTNCQVTETKCMIGCCGARINVDDSTVTESAIVDTNNHYNFEANSTLFENTVVRLPQATSLSIKNSLFIATKEKVDAVLESMNLPKAASGNDSEQALLTLSNPVLSGNSIEADGIPIGLRITPYQNNSSTNIRGNLFKGFSTAIEVAVPGVIGRNAFLQIEDYAIKSTDSKDINGAKNYYGTEDPTEVQNLLYDYSDDLNVGSILNSSDFLTEKPTLTPIASPQNLKRIPIVDGVRLEWEASAYADSVGYRIFFEKNGDYPIGQKTVFKNSVNVGSALHYNLRDVDPSIEVGVTAYNSQADDLSNIGSILANQTKGHESPIVLGQITSPQVSAPILAIEDFYESYPEEAITIDARPIGGSISGIAYQWYFEGAAISENQGGTEKQFKILGRSQDNGTWKVTVTNSEGATENSFSYLTITDTDGDGLSDYREENITFTNKLSADSDNDGITDAVEYTTNTDPNNEDTDQDGLKDGDEIIAGTNSLIADTDSDGYSDGLEVKILLTDPLQPSGSSGTIILSDFDENGTFTDQAFLGGPIGSVVEGGPTGSFYRLLNNIGDTGNNIAFPATETAGWETALFKMDVRADNIGADGFGVGFVDVATHGNELVRPGTGGFSDQEERGYLLSNSVGVGFRTFNGTNATVSYNGAQSDDAAYNLPAGEWVPVDISLTRNGDGVNISTSINGENVFTDFSLAGAPDNFRIQIGGRSGGASMTLDIDNVTLQMDGEFEDAGSEKFTESLPNEEAVADGSSDLSKDPSSYIYQWYFNDALIPASEGGDQATYAINGVPQNEGTWKVLISDRKKIREKTFEYLVIVDTDGDGLSDYREQNLTNTNFQIVDTDEDGLSDGDEITVGTDPLIADTDEDGIVDGSEAGFGTDPLVADTDEDGVLDGAETSAGTNPLSFDVTGNGFLVTVRTIGSSGSINGGGAAQLKYAKLVNDGVVVLIGCDPSVTGDLILPDTIDGL
ncbi:thrombospondin type 3 repeat-containing protein, partial [Akkermansiaceae bacterium]|nr:thrombospondin type 3 repeat-containing protein [Akkermansiaceae bacterium]